MVELVSESSAESGAAVESFGTVGIGEVGSSAAARSFGSGCDTAARCSNCCGGNSCDGNACTSNYRYLAR